MGALRDQTAFNIRERAGGRKQRPVRRLRLSASRLALGVAHIYALIESVCFRRIVRRTL